ncbi:hypothetical protein [Roseibium sp. MMSF_3544]|uniref:hypothetical protein n=1 Tax=unclassified Roseibium TaxID=2629323 RepID=UPI00273F9FE4|nr:hypothetical protein [Roseibium sp. MMSF_3544]
MPVLQLIRNPSKSAIAAVLVLLSLAELLYLYFGLAIAGVVSSFAFCGIILVSSSIASLREWCLAGICVLLVVLAFLVGLPGETIFGALERAAFFAAFIYLVTLLKEAAERSPSVLEIGRYLTSQPERRRYYATAFGGHLFGVLLNFGAISLLAPLVQRGARAGVPPGEEGERRARQLEQRQLSALIRGFCWVIIWTPTALTQAVILSEMPEADPATVIMLGLVASLVMILIGRVEDRFAWRALPPGGQISAGPFPGLAFRRLMAVCLFLIGPTVAIVMLSDLSTATAMMLMAPIVFIGWTLVLTPAGSGPGERLSTAQSQLAVLLTQSAPGLAKSAFSLGASGFIGIMAAALAPVDQIAASMNLDGMPAWLFLAALPILITLGGQLALSPIMVVVFLASVILELEFVAASQTMIAFALGAGWALSMTASPNATATLLISGVSGIPPTTLTWRWNGRYALLCYAAFCVFFAVLA